MLRTTSAADSRQSCWSAVKELLDAVGLNGAASTERKARWRELIKPQLSTAVRPLCSPDEIDPVSTLLFGDNLAQCCEELRDTHWLGLSAGKPPARPTVRRIAGAPSFRPAAQSRAPRRRESEGLNDRCPYRSNRTPYRPRTRRNHAPRKPATQ